MLMETLKRNQSLYFRCNIVGQASRHRSDEPWLGQLIKRGQLFSRDKLKSFRGSHKRCHQNASGIWIMEQGLIGTGFAYTEYSRLLPGA